MWENVGANGRGRGRSDDFGLTTCQKGEEFLVEVRVGGRDGIAGGEVGTQQLLLVLYPIDGHRAK